MRPQIAASPLEGRHSDISAVAQAAAKSIALDHGAKQGLFPGLLALHQARSALARQPRGSTSRRALAWQATWGILLGTGLLAALTAAVMFGPSGRKNTYISPDQAAAVASPAAHIGIALIAMMLVLPVATRPAARYGTACTALVGLVVAGLLAFRIALGGTDGRGFTSGQVGQWLPEMTVALVLLALLTWRLDVTRRRETGVGRPINHRARTEQEQHLLRLAEKLAGTTPARRPVESAAVLADWNSRLEHLKRKGITPATITQARKIGPAAWLVWVFYNGDIDVSGVLTG